jgi:hypothetical protein
MFRSKEADKTSVFPNLIVRVNPTGFKILIIFKNFAVKLKFRTLEVS